MLRLEPRKNCTQQRHYCNLASSVRRSHRQGDSPSTTLIASCLATLCGLNVCADLTERCTASAGQCFSLFSYYTMFVLRASYAFFPICVVFDLLILQNRYVGKLVLVNCTAVYNIQNLTPTCCTTSFVC